MGELKEWTLMFFFAGDNPLSPFVVSQLKAIKDAGFQENTDVVVYFDPNEIGAPTRIYDVNRKRKLKQKDKIGDGEDTFVHNMERDEILPKEIRTDLPFSVEMKKALQIPDEIMAEEALKKFLGFCLENHQAKHYILFLVGHGMVVANDAFLPDDNPVSGITLKCLGKILGDFTTEAIKNKGVFELLCLHSCSMSAVEVAYQLKGTARFMMASEGTSFLNSWPYRQLLKKTFKTIKTAKEEARKNAEKNNQDPEKAAKNPQVDVEMLMEKLYFLTLFNAKDFRLSGVSLDLMLCSLGTEKFTYPEGDKDLKRDVERLVAALKKGVVDKRGQELILLAHWESQSYWEERYTDLFDFCRCLSARCDQSNELQKEISDACAVVMNVLDPPEPNEATEARQREEQFKRLVIFSNSFGSAYQYSHGLSIYFPWSRPVENSSGAQVAAEGERKPYGKKKIKGILERYETDYTFSTDLGENSWFSFLDTYFNATQRKQTRAQEDGLEIEEEEAAAINRSGSFGSLPMGNLTISLNKPSPSSGFDCTCPSIKNYPKEQKLKKVRGKLRRNSEKYSETKGAIEPPQSLLE